MLPAAHIFSLLCTQGCSSFPMTCYQITTLIVYTTHGISWAVWQCPYSQVTSRMQKPQVCEQIWEVLRKDKQFVTTTLSRSLSFSLSMALFSPSSSRSMRRTVSPERVLNFFLKQHSQNDHLPKEAKYSHKTWEPWVTPIGWLGGVTRKAPTVRTVPVPDMRQDTIPVPDPCPAQQVTFTFITKLQQYHPDCNGT